MPKTYRAGIYARLSVDHQQGRIEKNSSIEAQIALAKAFIHTQPDIAFYECYTDLGRTGRNFQRQGFLHLMEQIRQGRINCIIIKDFSRLGRDYLETGNYIQNIFPQLNVRLIAIEEKYDSIKTNMHTQDTLVVNLKNLANEMYARDIAQKVKSTKKLQKEQGNYMGGIPPYGCTVQWCGKKRCLFAEDLTSDIVNELFVRYGAGSTIRQLVSWLYQSKIHRPKDYRRYGHVYCLDSEMLYEWPKSTLKNLLSNPVYISCYHKDHLRAHEPVITKEQFYCAAGRMQKQKRNKQINHQAKLEQTEDTSVKHQTDLFSGIVYCGLCHNKFTRTFHYKSDAQCRQQKQYGYYCLHSSKIDGRFCARKYIADASLRQIVCAALRLEIAFCRHQPDYFLQLAQKIEKKQEKATRNLTVLQKETERKKRQESTWYLAYQDGKITRQEFSIKKHQLEEEIAQIHQHQEEIRISLDKIKQAKKQVTDNLCQLFYNTKDSFWPKELLDKLLEKIVVFPGKRLTVTFYFREQRAK